MEASKALTIGEIEARISVMMDVGWRVKKNRLVSKSGVVCKILPDGKVLFDAFGSERIIGPFHSLGEFTAGVKADTSFSRYSELGEFADGTDVAQLRAVHRMIIRDKAEAHEMLEYVGGIAFGSEFIRAFDRYADSESWKHRAPFSPRMNGYPFIGLAVLECTRCGAYIDEYEAEDPFDDGMEDFIIELMKGGRI